MDPIVLFGLIFSGAVGYELIKSLNSPRNYALTKYTLECVTACTAPRLTMMDGIKDLLDNKPHGAPPPLNWYWWKLEKFDEKQSEIIAKLEYEELSKPISFFGTVLYPAENQKKTMHMRWIFWRFAPIKLEWWTEQGEPPSQRMEDIAIIMRDMTEDCILLTNRIQSGLPNIPNLAQVDTNEQAEQEPPPFFHPLANTSNSIPPPPSSIPSEQQPGLQNQQTGGLKGQFVASRRSNKIPWSNQDAEDWPATQSISSERAPTWPSPQDYNEALQNPTTAFSDVELKEGRPELNALGMPKAATGAFASVYRMHCGNNDFAVRCFLTPIRDRHHRYEELSRYIISDDLPYTVDFHYLNEGLKSGNNVYPILKMEWVEGTPLHIFLEQYHNDKRTMELLLLRFREMMLSLKTAGIAHGDLQHGNILIRDNGYVLVDYDGMYVPGLKGYKSNELGHPNYQHPKRDEKFFGANIDNFSAWVIDTSLMALRIDSSLWQKLKGGDECLLLRKNDFLKPQQSTGFNLLVKHKSPELQERALALLSMLDTDPANIPFLGPNGQPILPEVNIELNEQPQSQTGKEVESAAEKTSAESKSGLPDWLSDMET